MDSSEIAHLILARLQEERHAICDAWTTPTGTHTRHFVIDDLLPPELALAIYQAFPRNGAGFFDRESFREKKKTLTDLSQLSPLLSAITYALQDPAVVAKVAELVNFEQIVPDPSLYAGGLSMMFPGDFLNPHIDNSHGANRDLYRRLNLLYYVSPDWALENGGNFELWDHQVQQQKTLVSRFNRLVVMETNKDSWHSVSHVTADQVRCCVSNYYFSALSPDSTHYSHVTSFSGRPEEKGRRALGVVDNWVRNVVSKSLRVGRGRTRVNKPGLD
ncbi:2OG-Fe(II) oxygenase [Pseudomonas putida]